MGPGPNPSLEQWGKASFTKGKNQFPHGSGMCFKAATGTQGQRHSRPGRALSKSQSSGEPGRGRDN